MHGYKHTGENNVTCVSMNIALACMHVYASGHSVCVLVKRH